MRKKGFAVLVALLLVAGVVGVAFFTKAEENVTTFQFEEEINVVDGVADITEHSIPFTLEEDGTYVVNVEWTAEKTGMISGVALCNEAEEILFFCTGESVDAKSLELELEAGEYHARYMYFTNEQDLEALVKLTGATKYDDSSYDYAVDESYEMLYHFNINRIRSGAYNAGYLLGMLCGIGVGLLLVMFAFEAVKIKKGSNFEYDERQQVARGNGFKYGYITGLVYNGMLCLINVSGIAVPVEQSVLIMGGMLLSVLVYAVFCIQHDAYVSLNENANRLMLVFTILGGVNSFIGIMHCVHGTMIEDGILTFRSINLLCGILLLAVAVVLFAHTKLQAGEEE